MSTTLRELLEEGHQQLKNVGIVNPQLAAEVMLRTLLNLRRVDLYLKDTMIVTDEIVVRYREMVDRKLRREPLQYIIGETEWFGLKILCSRAALIPRPETEIIVERALELIGDVPEPLIADIGTGSGCIAIAVARSRADARVVATDISSDAIILARENISLHRVESQISLRLGNLLSPLTIEAPFDLIISNPPYIRETDYHALMPEVRDYEPQSALIAGIDGLDVIRELLSAAHAYLKSGGLLVMEIGEEQLDEVVQLARVCDAYKLREVIVDYNHKNRGVAFVRL